MDRRFYLLVAVTFYMINKLAFAQFCDISDLFANCSKRDLSNIPQNLPTNTTELDLSENVITEIGARTLNRYRKLLHLYIANNKISSLDSDAFSGLNELKVLTLIGNRLDHTKYPNNVFRPLRNIQELYLNRNMRSPSPFEPFCNGKPCRYSDKAFSWLVNLKVLSIDLCENPEFGEGFLNMKNLQKLSFDYCLVCKLSNKTFGNFRNSNVTVLNLSRCELYKISKSIEAGIFNPFSTVTSLDLSNSYFSLKHALKLLFPFRNKKMDMINFHRVSRGSRTSPDNPFKIVITSEMMQYLKTICVKTLIMSYNGIVDVRPNSLFSHDHPECFENIIMSANSFSVEYNIQYMEVLKLSNAVKNLRLFDYSYVPLQFSDMKFILPPNSMILNNHFPSLYTERKHPTNMTFKLPPKLEILRFSYVMSGSSLFSLILKNTKALKYLDLSHFAFQEFPDIFMPEGNVLEHVDFSGIDSRLYVDKGVIELMRDVKTILLRDANLDLTFREGKNVFKYFGNSTVNIDISYNHLVTLPKTFGVISNLEHVNLSFNSFRHFPKSLTSLYNLKIVDLRFNQLLTINKKVTQWADNVFQKTNLSLLLKGNEFACTCENRDFLKWLTQTKVLLDTNRTYYCQFANGTRTTTRFVVERFHETFSDCDAIAWLRIGVICIVSSFVIICFSAVIYQFRWRMAYFFYRKLKVNYLIESDDVEFKYDIFVAYASDCCEWLIGSLLPILEKEWKLSVCVKDRDFPVGVDRADTVINSMRNSKFIIFIITPGFIKRQWGKFEIEMAKYEMFEQRKQKRIIVIMKDGTSKEDVPIEFSIIWKDVIMIEWPGDDMNAENVWYDLKLQLS
ncbi:toll-like receptor 4 [Mytilus californianus]|uniref:toll-like receptor 4 n=1 Tax=Mytilus californianus TaxID=6549 RepID=UPI0022474030|nr:toll-like receptor 4 [Mytilus californianus]